ncbi:MAG: hypothetical protein ACE5GJ_07035 [Gemmatimonadota bacterium]
MEMRTAYCATCDKAVRVVVRREAPPWPSEHQHDPADIVCLEYGETCTGSLCPLFDLPTEQMKENLEAFRREEG